MPCALAAWCQNQTVTGAHNSSQSTFSPFPCHWVGAHVMCSGGLVSKPQGEPAHRPAHNVHFLYSRVIGWELMSCALGAWYRNHKVNRIQNQLILYMLSCHVPWSHRVNQRPKSSSHCTFSLCHGSKGLVSTPQPEPGTKPAHNA